METVILDPSALDPTVFTQVAFQAPWLLAAWLGYQLARKVLADLCKAVPEVLTILLSFADAAERVSKDGVKIKLDLGEDDEPPAPPPSAWR